MDIGSLVTLKSDSSIIYIIKKIENNEVLIKGINHRLYLSTTLDMLTLATDEQLKKEETKKRAYQKSLTKKVREKFKTSPIFGRVLHIDGDNDYLNSCLELYKEIGIHADGVFIEEENIKDKIEKLVLDVTPDIVVITGHDLYNGKGLKDLENYENTLNFMKAIRKIRKHFSLDELCIIAGACGSNYEALIASGANFASSPKRINIHTYDPVVVAIKVASTSINKTIDFNSCLELIENGRKAMGGVETKGKMRIFL